MTLFDRLQCDREMELSAHVRLFVKAIFRKKSVVIILQLQYIIKLLNLQNKATYKLKLMILLKGALYGFPIN